MLPRAGAADTAEVGDAEPEREAAQRQQLLASLGERALMETDLDELFRAAGRRLCSRQFGHLFVAMYALEPETGGMRLLYARSPDNSLAGTLPECSAPGLAERLALRNGLWKGLSGDGHCIADDWLESKTVGKQAVILAIPGAERPAGVLHIVMAGSRSADDSELLFLRAVCNVLTLADERTQHIAVLKATKQDLEREVVGRTKELRDSNRQLIDEIADRIRAEAAAKASEAHYRSLIENASDMIAVFGRDETFVYLSPSIERCFGFSRSEVVGSSAYLSVHQQDVGKVKAAFQLMLDDPGEQPTVTYRARTRDGRWLWIEAVGRNRLDDANVRGIVVNSRDITEHRAIDHALRNVLAGTSKYFGDEFFQALVKHLAQALDARGAFVVEYLVVGSPDVAVRSLFCEDPDDRDSLESEVLSSTRRFFESTVRGTTGSGDPERFGSIGGGLAFPVVDSRKRPVGLVGVFGCSTIHEDDHGQSVLQVFAARAGAELERAQVERQLLYNARHDSLTGLPNRSFFSEALATAIAGNRTGESETFALLFLDLDRFKVINDSLGHVFGDELLVLVGNRLRKCLQPEDLVARLSGDEFAVLINNIEGVEGAVACAQRIRSAFRAPFRVGGHDLYSTVSIGIAVDSGEYELPEEIIRDADTAMYEAKASGRARHEVFDQKMHDHALAAFKLETELQFAVEKSQFELYFQPIVSLTDGALLGLEALIRWQHPQRGILTPEHFLHACEETGKIVAVDRWAVHAVFRQLQEWQAQPDCPVVPVNVNISAVHFSQADVAGLVRDCLEEYQVDPHLVVMEITETGLMDAGDEVRSMLNQIRDLGVALVIDDFGVGYSSLGRLHRLPIDAVKIDRSFVHAMGLEGEEIEVVWAIVTLAHNMGMSVVAEGVESAEQAATLRQMQCERAQGFYYGRPVPVPEATALLTNSS